MRKDKPKVVRDASDLYRHPLTLTTLSDLYCSPLTLPTDKTIVHPWLPSEMQHPATWALCSITGISIWDREKLYNQLQKGIV